MGAATGDGTGDAAGGEGTSGVKVSAPGKLVLTGAYAVLEGATALVAAVDRRVVIDAEGPRAPSRHPEVRAALGETPVPAPDVAALLATPTRQGGAVKLGLGSSAAVLAATLVLSDVESAGRFEPHDVFARAFRAHRAAQGGGSGVDVAASVHGGVLAYRLERTSVGDVAGGEASPARLPKDLVVETWFSGRSARTSDLLAAVARLRERDAATHARRLRVLADEAAAAIEAAAADDAAAFVAGLARASLGLEGLGADASAPIVPDDVSALAAVARDVGAAVVPSGAGGGDVVLAAAVSTVPPALAAALLAAGFVPLDLALGAPGVRVEDGFPLRREALSSGLRARCAPPRRSRNLTMAKTSQISGLYRVGIAQRRKLLSDALGLGHEELTRALDAGGLDPATADKFVENVVGTYGLPYAVVLNVQVNGEDRIVPMVVEEPSVVAAASNAAKMVRAGGGFTAEVDAPIMIGQVQLVDVGDAEAAKRAIEAESKDLLARVDAAVPGLVARGGGARGLEVRTLGEPSDRMMVVHLLMDCRDAMGANLINTAAEAVADRLAALAGGRVGLRILTNLCDRRCVRVTCRVPAHVLATDAMAGSEVIDGILNASRFAELDPYRAATHNKGVMNGIDAVVIASGNDWRAVEAGAHAYAARNGRYEPLSIWRRDGDVLVGRIELPLALGTVGGTLRVHPGARLSLEILGVEASGDLAAVAAAVGLASNLAAVRALATDGIQRGHMALHARSVALAAGAEGAEVERVAAAIFDARDITVDGARRVLAVLRRGSNPDL